MTPFEWVGTIVVLAFAIPALFLVVWSIIRLGWELLVGLAKLIVSADEKLAGTGWWQRSDPGGFVDAAEKHSRRR